MRWFLFFSARVSRFFRLHLPTIFSLSAVCFALWGLFLALHQHLVQSLLAVLTAAIFDGLDGRLARLLNLETPLGKHLDPLGDLISFGIVPAFINYFLTLHQMPFWGAIAVIFYILCALLRLARFGATPINLQYFFGIPSPMAAGFALYPLVLRVYFPTWDILTLPWLLALWLAFVGILMVSSFPTFSFKKVPWQLYVLLLAVGLFRPVWFLYFATALVVFYILSIPLSIALYRGLLKKRTFLHRPPTGP